VEEAGWASRAGLDAVEEAGWASELIWTLWRRLGGPQS
jgi:hypothetical protein